VWNRVPTTVSCTFCQRHLPKAPRACQYHFEVQTKLSPQSCTLFVGNFPRSNYEPAETLLRRPQQPRYPEKRGSCLRVFSPVNSHISELLHFPAAWWWVVDMVMWLTWWWGWHGDVADITDQDHRPVTRKILN
jgi:hypothetical protein